MVMLKEELFIGIKDFVISASKLLYSYVEKGEQVPYTIVEKYEVKNVGSWSMTHVDKPLIIHLIYRHKKDISNLPEFRTCTELMQAEPQVSKHLDTIVGFEGGPKFRRTVCEFLFYFLSPILSKYLQEHKFDQQLLERLYHDFEDFVSNDQVLIHNIAYLVNFDSDTDKINIEKGLVIRKVTRKEHERLLQASKGSPSAFSYMMLPKYAIEVMYKRRKAFGTDRKQQTSNPAEKLYKLVTALRLFKLGVIGFNEITTVPQTPFLWGSTESSIARKTFIGPKYSLGKTEIIQFRDFWKRFSTIYASKPENISIAIKRFENAYERNRPQDKMIDHMIAYEALFFKQGETGEFGHKLSTRVAKFLGKTYEERKMISKEINEFYRKRSKVVHGEEVVLPPGFVEKVESYLRDSLKMFVERLSQQNHNEIISHLDLD